MIWISFSKFGRPERSVNRLMHHQKPAKVHMNAKEPLRSKVDMPYHDLVAKCVVS